MDEQLQKLFIEVGNNNRDPSKKVNFGILSPRATGITSTTMDPVLVERTLYEAYRATCLAFGEPEKIPELELYDPQWKKGEQ